MPTGPLMAIALATKTNALIEYWCSYCHGSYHDHPDDVEAGLLPGKPCDHTNYAECQNWKQEKEIDKGLNPGKSESLAAAGTGAILP